MAAEDAFSMRCDRRDLQRAGRLRARTTRCRAAPVRLRRRRHDHADSRRWRQLQRDRARGLRDAQRADSAPAPRQRLRDRRRADRRVLQRIESGVNLQAMIVPVPVAAFRFRVFGGPPRLPRCSRTPLPTSATGRHLLFLPADASRSPSSDFTSASKAPAGASTVGRTPRSSSTGSSASAAFAKFSRGSVDLENTLATAVGDDELVNVKAGGFQARRGACA